MVLEAQICAIRQQKQTKGRQIKWRNDVVLRRKQHNYLLRKVSKIYNKSLALITDFSKFAGFKRNIQKSSLQDSREIYRNQFHVHVLAMNFWTHKLSHINLHLLKYLKKQCKYKYIQKHTGFDCWKLSNTNERIREILKLKERHTLFVNQEWCQFFKNTDKQT